MISRGKVPFDFANKSLTLEDDDTPEDDELMSTSSFSKSRMDRLGESSLARGAEDEVSGIDPGINECL